METLIKDIRYGIRGLLKRPGFTLIAVVTLALGIGANTAIFSVVNAVLLQPLPYAQSERLVLLGGGSQGQRRSVSYPNYSDWRARAQSFAGMASVRGQSFNLTGVDKPTQLRGRTVNWNFFQLLGVQPQLGRMFVEEDDRYGAARTVLLSNELWKEHFAGDATVIGRKLRLDDESYEVIGVLPPGFEYFRADALYVPIGPLLVPQSGLTDRGSSFGLYAVARLKPGVTVKQADSEMAALAAQLESEYPAVNGGISAGAERLQDVMSDDVRRSLWLLFGAVGFILLIACVNVANLMLVRAADREKEIALRLALGASRARVLRQLLSESLLLALCGGVCGVLIGHWMLTGLLALAPEGIPQLSRVSLNSEVLLFTLGLSALTSVLCGLLPASHASRTDLQTTLKAGARSTTIAARNRTRKTLLVVEVSMAMVLLVGAGLLVRSMMQVLSVEQGFNPNHLLTMRIMLPDQVYDESRRRLFYDECLSRVSALPGVRSAALTVSLPIAGSWWDAAFTVSDKPVPPRAQLPEAALIPVTNSYFDAMGLQLLKGRWFNSADRAHSPNVAVINESMARRIWPGEDPIGKRMKHGFPENQAPWRELIGVVTDVKLNGLESDTPMQAYLPLAQEPWSNFSMVVRTTGDPLQAATTVERTIHAIDSDLPVSGIKTMDQLLGSSLAQRRLMTTLLVSLAVLALVLAAVGIYGVISYSVRQRTHELGVRLALGAQLSDVLKLVLKGGMKLALLGVAIGLAAAFVLTRLLTSLLFGVSPMDTMTFVGVSVVFIAFALLACWIPARRATKVDPLVALRYE